MMPNQGGVMACGEGHIEKYERSEHVGDVESEEGGIGTLRSTEKEQ